MVNVEDDLNAFVLGLTAKTSSAGGNSWNASAEGCWPPADGTGPDDDAYIAAQIQAVINKGFPVDLRKIWIWGHSCGGMMAYRYACNHPAQIAGVFQMSTFAIRTDIDAACAAGHFHYAHFHGTSDSILYDNNVAAVLAPNVTEYVSVETNRATPTRVSSATQAATQNQCAGTLTTTATSWLDFDSLVGGSETDLKTWSGCPSDGSVEVWKANGTAHVPGMTAAGYAAMVSWFLGHVQ